MTGPLRFWRQLRLGQKVMIAVFAAVVPLVALGVQVSNIAANLLSEQVRTNLGLASSIQAARMDQAMTLAESTMDAIENDAVVTESAIEVGSGSNTAQVKERLQAYLDLAGPRLSESGLVGLSFVLSGDASPAATYNGGVSPDSMLTAQTYIDSDSYTPTAFIYQGEPRFTTVRKLGNGVPLTVVAEWSIQQMIGHDDLEAQLGFEIESMLLQGQPDGGFLILASNQIGAVGGSKNLRVPNPVAGTPSVDDVLLDTASNREAVQAAARLGSKTGWIWLIEADADYVYKDLRTVRTAIITVFLIAGFLVLAVVAGSFRSLARRLARMNRLADSIAKGDLTVRTGDQGMDEIGQLSFAFDNMAEALSLDIARRERVEAQLAHQATHDPLTGLPNRQHLVEALNSMLEAGSEPVSALFIDLDGFKEVNDRLGHAAGDELLQRVGDRLRGVLRPGDFVARLGGDEFVIVLKGLEMRGAQRTASRVVSALELPFIVIDEEVGISASIGVSSSDSERKAETLLKQADIAMYQAKSLGKGRAVPVTDETLRKVNERASLISRLRLALQNDDLELVFSPIAELANGSLVGVEVTVAWDDPGGGRIAPADFLALAARSGFASMIDEWAIRSSLSRLAQWSKTGLPVHNFFLSLNMSTQSFLSQRTRTMLISELGVQGVAAKNVRIEVPEEVLSGDEAHVKSAFRQYRAMGIGVTIDQFGSDYSNIERLSRLAVDTVKIDTNLTKDLQSRVSSRPLVSSLISLALTSGMRVAASGVDDNSTRDELLSLGASEGQGRWFSSEVDANSFRRLLESRDILNFITN